MTMRNVTFAAMLAFLAVGSAGAQQVASESSSWCSDHRDVCAGGR